MGAMTVRNEINVDGKSNWFKCLCAVFFVFAFYSQALYADTAQVFETYKDRIFQIRIVDNASSAKASLGSGFAVGQDGLIMSNYHVIAQLVYKSDAFRAEYIDSKGETGPVDLVAIDVVHDLALLRIRDKKITPLKFNTGELANGEKIFSMGNPNDLGFTIVEGIYNGLINAYLYDKIHFTGSINPGMSGGPTLASNGEIIGVNVATAGNQMSVVIPSRYAYDFLQRTLNSSAALDNDFKSVAGKQLLTHQSDLLTRLMESSEESVELGHFVVPGKLTNFINCWGNTLSWDSKPYQVVFKQCASSDDVYLSESHTSGLVMYSHQFVSGKEFGRLRFYRMLEGFFNEAYDDLVGTIEDVSSYSCHTDFVENNSVNLKAFFCVREYRHFPGVYDTVLRAVSLEHDNEGLVTTLALSGVSLETATEFNHYYLNHIKWKP